MHPSGILESTLYVDDLEAAQDFYSRVLGLEPFAMVEKRHIFYKCGEQVFLLFDPRSTRVTDPRAPIVVPVHGAIGAGHICFRATAVEIELWRIALETNSVEIEADFEWPQGGRSIYFRDPAGNSLEFAEPRIWGLE
ncbi:MAG: VOC family protein [Hyphomicrobiaceae bacterium]